jgi:hypothetical protein
MGLLVFASLFFPQTTVSIQRTEAEEPILEPKAYISLFAQQYGAVENELLQVAKCESGYNPNAINYNDGGPGKHSVGIFQYQRATFDRFSKLMGEELDYYSYYDQTKLTSWIFANYPQYKKHWTCHRIVFGVKYK